MTFVTGKVKLVSFSLFLDAFPPLDPRRPLDNDMLLYTTYVKGFLGLGGGKVVVEAKEDIKLLTKIDCFAKWSFLLYINCIKIYTLAHFESNYSPYYSNYIYSSIRT